MTPLSLATRLDASLPAQHQFLQSLALDDRADFDTARRGFVGTIPDARITTARVFRCGTWLRTTSWRRTTRRPRSTPACGACRA